MAEEAFVLSPMSARASLPSEADYDAIRDAFMETARGRWFLSEFARRNRNTDTSMVLDAVARIEAGLVTQKQASTIGTLDAIRSAIRDAEGAVTAAMSRIDGDELVLAARDGVRIVRDVASMLRDCGADTRICDLLDTQVAAIDADQSRATTCIQQTAVLATFEDLVQRIERIVGGDGAPAERAAPASPPAAYGAPDKYQASVTPLFKTAPEVAAERQQATSAADPSPAPAVDSAPAEHDVTAGPDAATSDADSVQDLAVLDMVAMEMGAIDPDEAERASEPELAADARSIAPAAEIADVIQNSIEDSLEDSPPHDLPETAIAAMQQPSLGAALISSGVVTDPRAPAPDPLAPIRRMSQAEKIAFFS